MTLSLLLSLFLLLGCGGSGLGRGSSGHGTHQVDRDIATWQIKTKISKIKKIPLRRFMRIDHFIGRLPDITCVCFSLMLFAAVLLGCMTSNCTTPSIIEFGAITCACNVRQGPTRNPFDSWKPRGGFSARQIFLCQMLSTDSSSSLSSLSTQRAASDVLRWSSPGGFTSSSSRRRPSPWQPSSCYSGS